MSRPHNERTGALETHWTETGKQVVPFAWKVVIGRRNEFLQEPFGSLHMANQGHGKPSDNRINLSVTTETSDITAGKPMGTGDSWDQPGQTGSVYNEIYFL